MNSQIRKIALAFVAVASFSFLHAQVVGDSAPTPAQCVEALTGSGVTVSNITFNGQDGSLPHPRIGTFTVGEEPSIGITEGVVLGSGGATLVDSPNDDGAITIESEWPTETPDADLTQVSGEAILFDAAILEFDFIPNGDTAQFEFIFGSDEYNGFVNSFNDVFGIFLSGPGINGPYSNNSENIALIPGTDLPVTINNVNAGTDGTGCTNCEFFVENEGNTDPNAMELDGYTTLLIAAQEVQCGETYHLKFAIADVIDGSYDTAVMIKGGSLTSTGVAIDATAAIDGMTPFPGDSIIVEGCNTAQFTFFTQDPLLTEADFTILGTAENGVDYEELTGIVTFVNGVGTVLVDAIEDNTLEGTETVTFEYIYINECGDEIASSSTLYIQDYEEPVFSVEDVTVTCPGDNALLQVDQADGLGFVEYDWILDDVILGSGPSFTVTPAETTTYEVTNLDFCGTSFTETVTVIVPNNPDLAVADTSGDIFCPGGSSVITVIPTGGYEPYSFEWSNGISENSASVTVTPDDAFTPYTVIVSDACGSSTTANAPVTVAQHPPITWEQQIIPWCTGTPQFIENLNGGTGSYTFESIPPGSVSVTGGNLYQMISAIDGDVEVIATDGCGNSTFEQFLVQPCELNYYNVFTPNSDSSNAFFAIGGLEGFPGSKLTIFDRWGKIIFEDSSYSNDWDGKTEKGNEVPEGTYYYIFEPVNGAAEDKSGVFTIVR